MHQRLKSSHWIAPAACAGLAVFVRLIALYYYQQSPLMQLPEGSAHDRSIYSDAIQKIATGEIWPDGAFDFLPLYPWVVGVAAAMIGFGPLLISLAGILFDAITTALVVSLTRRLGAPVIPAMLAGALFALYPLAIVYSLLSMPNTLNALGVVAFAYAAQILVSSPGDSPLRKRTMLAAMFCLGALAGVITLGFAGMLLMSLSVAPLIAWKLRSASGILVFMVGLAAPIAPVALHNSRAEGQFVLLTTHGGLNLYMGNHEQATGYPLRIMNFRMSAKAMLEDAHRHAEEQSGRSLSKAESSRWWSEQARRFWRERPLRGIAITAKKAALFWNHRDVDDLRILEQLRITEAAFRDWPGTPFAVFGVLGLFGLFMARRAGIPKIMLLAGMAGLVMFFITARYRLTFVPLMAALGMAGLAGLPEYWKRHHRIRLLVLFPIAGLVMFPFTMRDQRPVDYYNAAVQLMAAGRDALAMDVIERGIAIDPDFPDLHFARGNALFKQENFEGAIDAYTQALFRNPNQPTAIFNLALSIARTGDICGARDLLLEMQARRMPIDERAQRLFADLNAACDQP